MSNSLFFIPISEVTWLNSVFRGFATYSDFISTGSAALFSGIAGFFDLQSIYTAYQDEQAAQRKTKLATHSFGLFLNILYALGAVRKYLSTFSLGMIALASDIVSLIRIAHATYAAVSQIETTQNIIKNFKNFASLEFLELIDQLRQEKEYGFKTKVGLAYNIISVASSILFVIGLFSNPVLYTAFIVLVGTRVMQYYDDTHHYKFSHWLAEKWQQLVTKQKPLNQDLSLTLQGTRAFIDGALAKLSDKPTLKTIFAEEAHKENPQAITTTQGGNISHFAIANLRYFTQVAKKDIATEKALPAEASHFAMAKMRCSHIS